jgi:hypothetical protein
MAVIRDQLKSSVAASSAPYGYTLTIWGSGAVAMGELGSPRIGGTLLFIAGAVLAFVLIEGLAYGSLSIQPSTGEPTTIAVWGDAHLLSAGGAVFVVWLLVRAIDGKAGWAVAGFAATAVYLLVNAVQNALASRAADS